MSQVTSWAENTDMYVLMYISMLTVQLCMFNVHFYADNTDMYVLMNIFMLTMHLCMS